MHPRTRPARKLIVALLALLATLPPLHARADNDPAARAKRIGILVLTGQDVELARVGALVFGNKRALIPAADASLSDALFDTLDAELLQEQRIEIKRLPVQKEYERQLAEAAYQGSRGFFRATLGDAQPAIAQYAKTCECDALLVVSSARGQLDGSSNQFFRGFAWVAYSGLGDEARKTQVATYLMLYLMDPASGKVLESTANLPDDHMVGHSVLVAASAWPKEMAAIDAEQWPVLVAAFRAELAGTLRRPLFKLGLRPSCTLHYHQIDNPPSRHPSQDTMEGAAPVQLPEGADSARCRQGSARSNPLCACCGRGLA